MQRHFIPAGIIFIIGENFSYLNEGKKAECPDERREIEKQNRATRAQRKNELNVS